jgi:endonuclease III
MQEDQSLSKKTDRVHEILSAVQPRWKAPEPVEGLPLFDQGIVAVLQRHMPLDRASAAYQRLRKAYDDWNEMRVAQVQEIAAVLKNKPPKVGVQALGADIRVAADVRDFVQEVFQKSHGLDLEFLKEDETIAGKLLAHMPVLGFATGGYLMWLASGGKLPVHAALVRTLDRLGIVDRTSSVKKARSAIEPLVPDGRTLDFTIVLGDVADRWCDQKKPICWECVLIELCPFGKKTYKEWKTQQERLAAQKQREEQRRLVQEKKDEERRRREDERQRKRFEADQQKAEREALRKQKAEQREREKVERQKKKEAAASREAARQERKANAAKKKALTPAKKPAPKKKPTARKSAEGPKKTVQKKKPTPKKSGKATRRPR